MTEKNKAKDAAYIGSADKSKKPKAKPGRKRLGDEVFVPVTMKVEPSDLATIESVAKFSHRSRSDVMREMLSYGLKHVMEDAFASPPVAGEVPASGADGGYVIATTTLEPALLDAIEAVAADGHVSRSAVVRQAVEEGLRKAGYPARQGEAHA